MITGAVIFLAVTHGILADVQDVSITVAGTRTFAPGDTYGSLINAASGDVTLDSSGLAVEADAISFTTFDATVAGATTVFNGGWWDFGVSDPSSLTANFMTASATLSNRSLTLENGAVVTNVGLAYVAGSSGTDNSLTLDGASMLNVSSLLLGCSTFSGQRSKVTVGGASFLNVFGMLSFSEGLSWKSQEAMSRNEMVISGTGSRLVVGGTTYLGRTPDGNYKTPGGNTFKVVDGASATLQGLEVSSGTWHCDDNHVLFGKDSRVTMTNLRILRGTSGGATSSKGNLVEILDGAVVTNSGEFAFGTDHSSCIGNKMVVSNATFHLGSSYGYTGGGNIMIAGRNCELWLSGPDAKLSMGVNPQGFFFGQGSSLIVDDRAEYMLPVGTYSYTKSCIGETMRFCMGANVTRSGHFGTGDTYHASGISNRLEITSGASFTVGDNGHMRLVGDYSELVVDDGSFSVASALYLGTNGLDNANAKAFSGTSFRIVGTRPSVQVGWDIVMASNSKLVFSLPEGGYDSGFATSEKPVISCGANKNHRLRFYDTAQLVFENAAGFLRSHKKKRDYVLVNAYSSDYLANITAEKLAQMSAGFPAGLTLENTGKQLLLHAHPIRGISISFY